MSADNRSQKQNIELLTTEYSERIALGLQEGADTWSKFGYNDDVDTTSAEVLAAFGGVFDQRISIGETLSIVSSDAQDNSAGTGVRLLVIFGVDENWLEVTDVVTMTGLTPVTSNLSFLGVNRMTIFTSGSSDGNVGTITATASSSGNVMASMPAAQGTTQQCIFYVPSGKTFLATWLTGNAIKSSGGGNPSVTYKGYVYANLVDSVFEVVRFTIDTSVGDHFELTPAEPFVITEKSIFWLECETSSNNTSARGRFSGKLITNES